MRIETLRKVAGREEIDYPFLISALSNYARPRDKISEWLKSGDLIRVKKGLYVFGHQTSLEPYNLEILANLIYGPSAVSLSYALSFYGLIPERVTTVTSVTSKRFKEFITPVGHFVYYYLSAEKFSTGIEIQTLTTGRQCMISIPEKALCDQICVADKNIIFKSIKEIEVYLIHDLRIDKQGVQNFKIDTLTQINKAYRSRKISLLIKLIKKWNM